MPTPTPSPATGERLLRLRDVCDRVHVGKSTVWRWVSEGRFPRPIRLGARCTVWRQSDLDAWMADPAGWQDGRA